MAYGTPTFLEEPCNQQEYACGCEFVGAFCGNSGRRYTRQSAFCNRDDCELKPKIDESNQNKTGGNANNK